MAELATIARPYAEALFRVALPAKLNAWADILSEMAQIAAVPDFQDMAHDPRVPRQVVIETFLAALKTAVDAEARNFIGMLADNGRLALLPEIEHQFHDLKNAHESTADAEIVSAYPMDATQVSELVTALEKKFGRKLIATVSVDSSLIGGVRVTVGDEVLDQSVSARLQRMHTALVA
ncbi:MAG: F0F1 ATP synthase subunit delta [Oxalobacteraceae bacterium]|jgi:F-type H+-transporting ATPase subunit delta|nr:F0F1 ATP synthase subunit delta [Oxalobacteraceae bacterium]